MRSSSALSLVTIAALRSSRLLSASTSFPSGFTVGALRLSVSPVP